MQNDTAIKVDHVSKLFFKQEQRTMKEMLPALFAGKKTSNKFWAVNDVSFEVKKGESIGIIGPNGSGKSTLLKLIAGVTNPTKGTITTRGRVAPLIELGAGFHPELTGRENVYLNGVILCMSRKEIDGKFKEIVDFAELWEFIDQPIKHYSSGMYLRLAFAVAVHTDPDILLVDEILAVGDEKFQNKCFKKMFEFKEKNVSIVYISHNLSSVKTFCNRVIYVKHGIVVDMGDGEKVVNEYIEGID